MAFLTVFMWLCLALFAGAGVIWLLDMVGVLTIRTSPQRTMLNASLGTTLLGGMASFAVATFFPTSGTAPAGGAATPSAPSGLASGPATPAPTPTAPGPAEPTETPAPPPPAPPQAACKAFDHPPSLAQWASTALGPPPTFRCATLAPYPPCLEELRTRSLAEISREAARACGDSLLEFRRIHIQPVYTAKNIYQDKLDAAEASLRAPREGEEEARRDHVVSEIARMNGRAWADFTALDQRSRSDMLACQSNTERCLIAP